MKTATYTLAAIAIFAAGVTTGVYAAGYKTKREIALDNCAREHWVYKCMETLVPKPQELEEFDQAGVLRAPAAMEGE